MEYESCYVLPLFGGWTLRIPFIAETQQKHCNRCEALVFVYYRDLPAFTQSFSYFPRWRLFSFSSSSFFSPVLNIALLLFVCVLGNRCKSKPPHCNPPPAPLGWGSGGWPLASQLPPPIILQHCYDAAGRGTGAPLLRSVTASKLCLLIFMFSCRSDINVVTPTALWMIVPSARHLRWLDVCSCVICNVLWSPSSDTDSENVCPESGSGWIIIGNRTTLSLLSLFWVFIIAWTRATASPVSQQLDHFFISWLIDQCKPSQLPSNKEKPFCCCHLASENLSCFFSGFDVYMEI